MNIRNQILVFSFFLIISVSVYLLQNLFFHQPENTLFYMMQDLAFLPVQAVLVTGFINVLLSRREKEFARQKINMTISAFFGETGNPLLSLMLKTDHASAEHAAFIRSKFPLSEASYRQAHAYASRIKMGSIEGAEELENLKNFLVSKRSSILDFMKSNYLMEHQTFSELLWSLLHLADELSARTTFPEPGTEDHTHLKNDITRVYGALCCEWLGYARHLRDDYPYMYSFILRVNPFIEDPDPNVY